MHDLSSKHILALAVSALLMFCVFGCGGNNEAHGTAPHKVKQLTQVATAKVALRDFQYSVQASGTLVARRQTKLNALVDGQIDRIPVDIGSRITKGQLLFRIREVDYNLAYRQAEANLTRTKVILKDRTREKNRMQNLFKAGSATQQSCDRAITAYEEAEAALAQARVARDITRQALTDCTIFAPYDGVVTARYLEEGEYAKRGTSLIEIIDLSTLNAELELPERYAGKMFTGLPVTLSVNSRSDSIKGAIVAVNPKVSVLNRTFLVKVAVNNQDGALQAGLFCSALFHMPIQKNQMAVPFSAITRDEGRTTIWIVKDDKAYSRIVHEGGINGDWVRILDGVTQGEEFITGGTSGLIDGVTVSVTNQAS
jgi:RND family efflux transporter MFP subunit